ncbi:MAG: PDZ domain-containing protein [Pirellulaceae bacterium]
MSLKKLAHYLLAIPFALSFVANAAFGQAVPQDWLDEIKFRSIGPANMGGRIVSIAAYEKDPSIWWAASASGGLVKTTNNGIDFEHQFDDQATVSIGDVQVCQSNPEIVWVGTGEANPRNSVSYGDGVYKSTDGGKTWKNMGLKKSFQIGRIAINPQNPDEVYVGALGRLWGPSEERGLFKTTDGGKKWEKILFIDDKTGVIDVQMNPRDPQELIVATYERLRDNTDDNDPIKKYGPGAGIYRTRDGGKTFEKLSNGLPSCNLGRIGLNYYRKNPKFIYAIIESEKIASAPENQGYAGIRTENADVGARVTRINRNSPAEESGLKEGDIVIQADGKLIQNYEVFDNALRRKYADEVIKLVVSRDGKFENLDLKLGKVPETRGRRTTGFEGTLGGQIENRQEHQGDDGFEFGGIYLSKDGGDSWTRINSLNPRPMYYSQIRVDPVDNKNLYVLGTELYKSNDGGATFTNDGGSDGIHVDHHAMWIDPSNPKRMILGNDGGIHMTYDRMENWAHLNHVALCQFYHVSVDSSRDYKVYGGLQDNGSWGGPNRTSGNGPVNADWFRVGSGDGFVTWSDPNDIDQIYAESQGGNITRMNLRTGERGFIRPQPPRGVSYRFNWKTPYILSPHNSQMMFSAGNYVFRSYSKGDRMEAISEEITNSNNGSGSAIAESPMKAGVLYVGTTDGALWVTQNGGNEWTPILYNKIDDGPTKQEESESGGGSGDSRGAPSEGESAEAAEPAVQGAAEAAGEGDAARPARRRDRTRRGPERAAEAAGEEKAAEQAAEPKAKEESADPEKPKTEAEMPELKGPSEAKAQLAGKWKLVFAENAPQFLQDLKLDLSLADDNTVSGFVVTSRGEREIKDGKFDPGSNQLTFSVSNQRGSVEYDAKLEDGKLVGKFIANEGQFSMAFTGEKIDEAVEMSSLSASLSAALSGIVMYVPDDSIDGTWKGLIESDQLPEGRLEFELDLKVGAEGEVTGKTRSQMGELELIEGFFNKETKALTFSAESTENDMVVDFEATVDGNRMKGNIEIVGNEMNFQFVAEKKAEQAQQQEEKKSEEKSTEPKQEAKSTEKAAEKSADTSKASEQAEEPKAKAEPKADDGVTGTWKGEMQGDRMPRGMGEFTIELKMDDKGNLSGQYTNARGESEISEGSYNAESKAFNFVASNGRFEMEFNGTIDGEMEGEITFGGRNFSTDFTAKREGNGKIRRKSFWKISNQGRRLERDVAWPTLGQFVGG